MAASLQGTLLTDFLPKSEIAAVESGTSTFDAAWAIGAAAAHGKPVILPAGVIYASAFPLGVSLYGCGKGVSTLRCGKISVTASDVELRGVAIDPTSDTAVSASNVSGLVLSDVRIGQCSLALDAYNVGNLSVSGCDLSGGIQMSGCDGFSIHDNLWECDYTNTAEPIHASANSHGIVAGNTIKNTATDAIDLYSSGSLCIVSGNRIDGCRGACAIEAKVTLSDDAGNSSGGSLGYVESTIIADNIITGLSPTSTGTRSAIYAEYVDSRASPSFSVSSTVRGVRISGNIIEGINSEDTGVLGTYWGIAFTGHNSTIDGNIIRGIRSHNAGLTPCGIRLSQPSGSKCVGLVVSGNVISGIEGWAAIDAGPLERCVFSNNIIRQDGPSGVVTKFGINLTGQVSECLFSGNTFELNTANSFGVRMASGQLDRCSIVGNVFSGCGVTVAAADFLAFSGNQISNAANSQGLTINGGRGAKITGNHFTLSDDYAVVLTDHSGFVISDNTFNETNRPIAIVGASMHGIVSDNISYSQMQAAPVFSFSGVSAENQATIFHSGSIVI